MDQEEQRHKCRLCSKSFLCGRSLGGHMRSHMSSSSSTSFVEEYSKLSNGYGLRESPKKTWRLSSSVSHDEEEKQCRECGKEFQSWRALFGHMRCHSPSHSHDKIIEEEDGSWRGEGLVRVPRKKRRPRRSAAIAGPSSSSASEDHEEEDVAISLMMLSRDAGYWGSDNPAAAAVESSDKNSAILEEDNRELGDFKKPKSYHVGVDDLYAEKESDDEGSRKGSCAERKRRRSDGYGAGPGKSRYECATCKKSFHSYQALGGHRASHKRLKGRCCGSGSSFRTDAWVDRIVVDSAKASAGNNDHRCGVCGKVFASGQALGGHKRSHLVTSSPTIVIEEDCEEEEETVVVMPDLLDLNLPAPVDEDSSNQGGTAAAVAVDIAEFNSWWRGSNLKNEAMIAN